MKEGGIPMAAKGEKLKTVGDNISFESVKKGNQQSDRCVYFTCIGCFFVECAKKMNIHYDIVILSRIFINEKKYIYKKSCKIRLRVI